MVHTAKRLETVGDTGYRGSTSEGSWLDSWQWQQIFLSSKTVHTGPGALPA
jgi:hypothetical protein